MTTFFSSDTHLGHENILIYNAHTRPFASTEDMDEAIISNWNSVVSPEDTVYHLGDVALGTIAKSLPKVARLNGYKICVLGNHDRPFMREGKADEMDWWDKYAAVFQEVRHWFGSPVTIGKQRFIVSHFPYTGDHTPEDRHSAARPVDDGIPLIHGHTHSTDRLTFSSKGTPQIHVGMDAHNLTPVSEYQVLEIMSGI